MTFAEYTTKLRNTNETNTVVRIMGDKYTKTSINDYAETYQLRIDGLSVKDMLKLEACIKTLAK